MINYFKAVKDTKIISEARKIFEKNLNINNSELNYVPYIFDNLPNVEIKYDELKKLFIRRRSVRLYKNKVVPINLISKAIDLATLAPSACNRQPYTFYVSDDKNEALEIAKCAGGTPGWAENIPCTIVVVGDLSAYPEEKDRHLIYIDGSLATMQLILAFQTLGLSTCTINWPDIEIAERKLNKLLNLKPYERPIMLLSVGYAKFNGGIPYSQKKNSKTLIKNKKKIRND